LGQEKAAPDFVPDAEQRKRKTVKATVIQPTDPQNVVVLNPTIVPRGALQQQQQQYADVTYTDQIQNDNGGWIPFQQWQQQPSPVQPTSGSIIVISRGDQQQQLSPLSQLPSLSPLSSLSQLPLLHIDTQQQLSKSLFPKINNNRDNFIARIKQLLLQHQDQQQQQQPQQQQQQQEQAVTDTLEEQFKKPIVTVDATQKYSKRYRNSIEVAKVVPHLEHSDHVDDQGILQPVAKVVIAPAVWVNTYDDQQQQKSSRQQQQEVMNQLEQQRVSVNAEAPAPTRQSSTMINYNMDGLRFLPDLRQSQNKAASEAAKAPTGSSTGSA
jgi:hypothetical protein